MKNILAKILTLLIIFIVCIFVTAIDSIIEQQWLFLFIMSIIVLAGALYLVAPDNFLRDIARKLFDDDEL